MISSIRQASLLVAGCAMSALAACGPGTLPEPATPAPAAEAETSTEEIAAPASQTVSAEDHADNELHDGAEDEDHDHDHEGDHAGGSAHVHGIADLAFVFEGGKLTAEMISPLANFGLSESDGVFTDEVKTGLPGLITVTGGDCSPEAPVAEIDTSSGHTDGHVTFSWTCVNPANVTAAQFTGFAAFPGFETVNAVFVSDTVQKAAELTSSSPVLSLK